MKWSENLHEPRQTYYYLVCIWKRKYFEQPYIIDDHITRKINIIDVKQLIITAHDQRWWVNFKEIAKSLRNQTYIRYPKTSKKTGQMHDWFHGKYDKT